MFCLADERKSDHRKLKDLGADVARDALKIP